MRRTYCFKMYRSKRSRRLHDQLNLAASIYNHCIALHKRYYRLFKSHISLYRLHKHLTKLKRLPQYQHWKQLDAQATQDIAERIEKGYQLFFRSLKSGSRRRTAPPSFRKRAQYKSITLKQTGYKLLDGNKIRIGKHIFRYHKSRDLCGTIKTVTLKRDPRGDFYLYFSCVVSDAEPTNRTMTGKIAGFDFGLRTFLTASDGQVAEAPQFFRQGLRQIKRASQQLSSKKRGSNNRRKARLNLARTHRKIANHRRDFHFKLAKALVDQYDVLFFEDLNLEGMKGLWGRKVSDLGFHSFQQILQHMAAKSGAEIRYLDKWFPSSKLCRYCGTVNDQLSLRDISWVCTCGAEHNRDLNAAINILMEGASSIGLGNVRQVLAPAIAV